MNENASAKSNGGIFGLERASYSETLNTLIDLFEIMVIDANFDLEPKVPKFVVTNPKQ